MHIPDDWRQAANRITSNMDERCLVVVVGVPDTGKSTCCTYLARRLTEAGVRTGVVDADVGQSNIGPPAVISGGLVPPAIDSLADIALSTGYFLGSTSPTGHLLASVVGTQRVCQRLQSEIGAQAIVVDTSGLVRGGAGRALKEYKIALLQPSHVVLIQHSAELDGLARLWQCSRRITLHKLRPSPKATARPASARRAYRSRRWMEIFHETTPLSLPFDRLAVRGTCIGQGTVLPADQLASFGRQLDQPALYGETLDEKIVLVVEAMPEQRHLRRAATSAGDQQLRALPAHRFSNLLCGLLDGEGNLLTLAILHHADFLQRQFRLLLPAPAVAGGRILQLGRVLVRADGQELAALRPGDL